MRRGLDSFRPIAGIDCFRTPVIQCNRSTFTRDGKKTYPLALSAFPLETTSVVHHNNLRARKSAGCLDTQAQDSYCGFFSASARSCLCTSSRSGKRRTRLFGMSSVSNGQAAQ